MNTIIFSCLKKKKKKLNLVIQIVSSAGNDRLLILGAEHFRERWLERSWEHLHKIDYNNRSAICKRIDNYPIDYSFNLPLLLSLWEFGHFSRLFHPILHESVNTAEIFKKNFPTNSVDHSKLQVLAKDSVESSSSRGGSRTAGQKDGHSTRRRRRREREVHDMSN